jgi:hypothetical protein
MRNMMWEQQGNVFMMLHRAEDPNEDEWRDFMETFKKLEFDKVRQLVFTDGGGPNAKQRQMINDVLAGRTTLIAVVSPSTKVRAICTALSWFNKKMAAFAPEETPLALRHIGVVSTLEVEQVWRLAFRLRDKLGDKFLKVLPAMPPAA